MSSTTKLQDFVQRVLRQAEVTEVHPQREVLRSDKNIQPSDNDRGPSEAKRHEATLERRCQNCISVVKKEERETTVPRGNVRTFDVNKTAMSREGNAPKCTVERRCAIL